MTDYLTIKESAEFLGIKERTFHNWRSKRGFPKPLKYSQRTIRFVKADLQKWKDNPT